MSSSPRTVLITGGTGFLGSHIITQLIKYGYNIRATTRMPEKLLSIFPNIPKEQLEVVRKGSLVEDHTDVLRGVDAVIHTAAPLPIRPISKEEIIDGAYHGTINLIEAAVKLGTKKIVVTSSAAALMSTDLSDAFGTNPIGPDSWGPERMDALDTPQANPTLPEGIRVYHIAKMDAERRVWQIAGEHPEVDITTFLPPVILGPFVSNFGLAASPESLGSNSLLRSILDTPNRQYPENILGQIVDVRDVARAHVLALSAPPLIDGRRKRLIMTTRHYHWNEVVKIILEKDPEAANRLPAEDAVMKVQLTTSPLDTSLTEEALGMGENIPAEETIHASFEAIMDWEKKFKA